jgi:transcriptional regulator with XRE-family HTH domain
MTKTKNSWARGEQAELARTADISAAYLCDILKGRKSPRIAVAKRLAAACKQLNIPLELTDWIDPASSSSPLIGG